MIAVIDASAAVRVALDPDQNLELAKLASEAELVLAPELLAAEVANAYWKYLRAGTLSRAACESGIRASLELVDEFASFDELALESFDLAALAKQPVYDMFYLVLARRRSAWLITADETMVEHARRLGIRTEKSTHRS